MQVKLNSIIVYLVFIVVVIISIVFSTGIVDTGDGIAHFNISKYSWKYPKLFLDHWGKPLFTLLSSPFAQFGMKGMIVFNLIAALLTGHFLQRTGKSLGIEQRWLILLCLFAAPVYFEMVIAGMTEVLFAMFCSWGICLLLEKKYVSAALVLSFLPFARPEAYVVLPFFILYILLKEWRALPILLAGTLLYAIAGAIMVDDWLWLVNKDPYASAETGAYGFGKPFDFLKSTKDILGIPISIIFVLAALLLMFSFSKEESKNKWHLEYWILLILPAIAIMVIHSYLWWKGLHGSAGLKRVIATSAPMVAVVAGSGLVRLADLIPKELGQKAFLVVIALLLCFTLYDRVDIIVEYNRKHLTTQKASQWVKGQLNEGQRLFYLDPLVGYELGLDPFAQEEAVLIWSMENAGINAMRSGDILFWETHYAPQEGELPKQQVINDEKLELIYELSPDEAYPMRDSKYEVLIFKMN